MMTKLKAPRKRDGASRSSSLMDEVPVDPPREREGLR
jgi:hypothetical protein